MTLEHLREPTADLAALTGFPGTFESCPCVTGEAECSPCHYDRQQVGEYGERDSDPVHAWACESCQRNEQP
tara:strand:+ start:1384 stop:1596 length:213 start_codon:yes stop_codon:yes gene_type:complete